MLGPAFGQVKPDGSYLTALTIIRSGRAARSLFRSRSLHGSDGFTGTEVDTVFSVACELPARRLTGQSPAGVTFESLRKCISKCPKSFPCPSAAAINECLLYFCPPELKPGFPAAGVRHR
jgi:hypothetical protein